MTPLSAFELEDLSSAAQVKPGFIIPSSVKPYVLLRILEQYHENIRSWTARTYQTVTWSIGLEFAVVGFVFVHWPMLIATVAIAIGLSVFASAVQIYLRAAARAHHGNRLAIAKCEGALALYQDSAYLSDRPFFVFSPSMLKSKSLGILSLFHSVTATIAIALVLIGGFLQA